MSNAVRTTWEDEAHFDPRPTYAPEPEKLGPVTPEIYRKVYGGLAVTNADEALKIINLRPGWWWQGSPSDAAWHARLAYSAAIKHQQAGGQPTDTF